MRVSDSLRGIVSKCRRHYWGPGVQFRGPLSGRLAHPGTQAAVSCRFPGSGSGVLGAPAPQCSQVTPQRSPFQPGHSLSSTPRGAVRKGFGNEGAHEARAEEGPRPVKPVGRGGPVLGWPAALRWTAVGPLRAAGPRAASPAGGAAATPGDNSEMRREPQCLQGQARPGSGENTGAGGARPPTKLGVPLDNTLQSGPRPRHAGGPMAS